MRSVDTIRVQIEYIYTVFTLQHVSAIRASSGKSFYINTLFFFAVIPLHWPLFKLS
jgi:hypothetical protein